MLAGDRISSASSVVKILGAGFLARDHSLDHLCQFGKITAHSGVIERHPEKRVVLVGGAQGYLRPEQRHFECRELVAGEAGRLRSLVDLHQNSCRWDGGV